ncbi:MAG TPA: type I glyceraldehyde-3-phosphate dehydrogenase [Myxococcales bacterium]|nr:type I glyceraldehyde-3-phosphate dehydrogenase [Myxococcales bacterium]HIN86407.1 type I glyceraldehyde-3-phosphate dehydrogenase [Myxococcales bacterium]
MTTRVAINGFGRIGRSVFRILSERNDIDVVAINDLFENEALAYLLKHDTVMGIFDKEVTYDDSALYVDGNKVLMTCERDPARLPWGELGIDVTIESTGVFRTRELITKHLEAGARRVLLTVPPKDDVDAMIVMGVNSDELSAEHRLVSNASCTTNCLAPVAMVLDEAFGIENGVMTTVHAYTNDQRLADVPHHDFRRSRAAAENIIPTSTGAARAVGKVLPQLNGKLDGVAARVPVPDGSVVDLVVKLVKSPSVQEINAAIEAAATTSLTGILEYCVVPVVSSDIIGNPHSSIFDSLLTQSFGDGHCRIVSWYDNEWGYSNRCVDLIERMAAFG